LTPSGRAIDFYPLPPNYLPVDRGLSDGKRRDIYFPQLLGSPEDVTPEDPVFVLRRVVTNRTSSSHHRPSAPLDETALEQLDRDKPRGPRPPPFHSMPRTPSPDKALPITPLSSSSQNSSAEADEDDAKQRHMSKQELNITQRAAQRAILSAQPNSRHGIDLLLHNNAVLRSSRYNTDERTRYSYVDGGETYDISDIMEEEWDSSASAGQGDLLEGVLERGRARDGVEEKLDRVLSKLWTAS
jgi:hypothetical protein